MIVLQQRDFMIVLQQRGFMIVLQQRDFMIVLQQRDFMTVLCLKIHYMRNATLRLMVDSGRSGLAGMISTP